MRRFGIAITLLALAGACALPSTEEFASGSPDAGTNDGGQSVPSDGAPITRDGEPLAPFDSGADVTTVVLDDGGSVTNLLPADQSAFEIGDCGSSGRYESKLEASNVPRSGARSCKVCRAPGSTDEQLWSIDNGFDAKPREGQEYRAEAWVRRPPGSTDQLRVALSIRTVNDPFDQVEQVETDTIVLTDEWQRLATTLPLTKRADFMDVFVYAVYEDGTVNRCFLVDDLVVWQTK